MKRFYELVEKHFNQGITLIESSDFCYFRDSKVIAYSVYAPTDGVKEMYETMVSYAIDTQKEYISSIPICILCILHEYGHHFTKICNEELEEYLDDVEIIEKAIKDCKDEKEKEKYTKLYRRLSLETYADKWVVNWAIKHKNLIIQWVKFGQKYIDSE